jgi:hypothetical protein
MDMCVGCREELASLNRSIQSTAKGIKSQLEGLSRDRATLPEPQQAKLRKLMQDFAAALQVGPDETSCTHQQLCSKAFVPASCYNSRQLAVVQRAGQSLRGLF